MTRPGRGSRARGTRQARPRSAHSGTLTRNTDPHEKCSRSRPPPSGPITMPRPDTPAQMPIALARSVPLNVLVRIDSVVGKMSAAPAPIRPRAMMRTVGEPACDANAENAAEQHESHHQGRLAPEAVTERTRGQQQTGEHDGVGVDDPLQLRAIGAELADDRRERDVEDRVVDADHHQRQAQHAERPPASTVDAVGAGRHGTPGAESAARSQNADAAAAISSTHASKVMTVESSTRW